MGDKTGISWTDHTFNPWWGCTKVSAGCDNCYADTLSNRYGFDVWGPDAPRRFFGDKHWAEPLRWNEAAERAGKRARVFCGSMCDWAEGRPDQAEARARLFALIEATPWLDWQLLTKRPGAIPHLVPARWLETPPPNVWYGTSVENQEQAERRIAQLLKVPAVVRFLSCEPLLGPVDLWMFFGWCGSCGQPLRESPNIGCGWCNGEDKRTLHWVITGGESGPNHRPIQVDWVRSIRDRCQAAAVAFFHKQWGGNTPRSGGDLLDGRQYHEFPQAPAGVMP